MKRAAPFNALTKTLNYAIDPFMKKIAEVEYLKMIASRIDYDPETGICVYARGVQDQFIGRRLEKIHKDRIHGEFARLNNIKKYKKM